MRAFKLAKAELSKLFFRPAMYFLTAFLVIALILISLIYTPAKKEDTSVNFGTINQTVSDVFATFNDLSSTHENAKINLDKNLLEVSEKVTNFNQNSELLNTITSKVQDIYNLINSPSSGASFYNLLMTLANNPTDQNARENFIKALETLRADVQSLYTFLDKEITSENIDFYITKSELSEIKDFFYKYYNLIPREAYLSTFESDELVRLGNIISTDYKVDNILSQLNSFKKIQIDEQKVNEIIANYYTAIAYTGTQGSTTVLDAIYNKATTFVSENSNSKEGEHIDGLNAILTEYKQASLIAINLMNASFTLEKAGDFSDLELTNYIGFSDFNRYSITEKLTLNTYLLENQIFDNSFSLNVNLANNNGSGIDFFYYAMQILSIIITVFCVFFMSSLLAGEQSGGTMKMLCMRPFTKSKIISGKTLACLIFMFIFVIFAGLASFVVGFSLYGYPAGSVAMVINAQTVLMLPPFVVALIYLVLLSLSIMFYIILAAFLSVILRSNVFAVFITFSLLILGTILNGLCANTSWYLFTPFAHLDIFRYFGNASAVPSMFNSNMIVDGNIFISLGVLLGLSLILYIATKAIFKTRDIA